MKNREKFIQENHINDYKWRGSYFSKERSSILENKCLSIALDHYTKTATNITEEDYKYVNFISELKWNFKKLMKIILI